MCDDAALAVLVVPAVVFGHWSGDAQFIPDFVVSDENTTKGRGRYEHDEKTGRVRRVRQLVAF